MFKTISVSESDFDRLHDRKERTGQSIKAIINKALDALDEQDKQRIGNKIK